MAAHRIEKKILLNAPRARVWRAVSNADAFGSWFGAAFEGEFVEGARLKASIVPTTVDPEVAKHQKAHEGMRFDFFVERVEPMGRIAFRWHPYAIDPAIDYSDEPTTLIVFELREVPGGTMLTVTESGFEHLPEERRAKAFEMNERGWGMQMRLLERYLASHAA